MEQQTVTSLPSRPERVGIKINWRALAIAASAGFVLELILAFAGMGARKGTQGGIFGPSQQDQALAVFSALALGIFGLLVSASIGSLYAWLCRSTPLLPRAVTLGGALAAILPAFCGKAMTAIAILATSPTTADQSQTAAVATGALVIILIESIFVGGGFGALGAWLIRRLMLSKQG